MRYCFSFEPEDYLGVCKWCLEEIGPRNGDWAMAGNNDIGGEVFFKKVEDATAFKLTWI